MKSLFNKTLFKEQMKRFYSIPVITIFVYILFIIMPLFRYEILINDSYNSRNLLNLIALGNPILIMSILILPLAIVGLLFFYLFQQKASITILAYPIKRDSLWVTNAIAGFVLMIIPILFLNWVMLFISFWAGYDFLDVINFFFKILLCFMFYYSIFLLSASICGNNIIYILVSVFLPFLPGVIALITDQFIYHYVVGVPYGEFVGTIFSHTNPILVHQYDFEISHTISYLLIMICLFVMSFYSNRLRKQEHTGDSVVFNLVCDMLIFIISIIGAFLGSYFFANMYQNIVSRYIGMFVGFLITYYIAQMFALKSFNAFKKATKSLIKFGGITFVLFLTLLCTVKFDLFGYERYVPKIENIESVTLLGYNYDDAFITDQTTIEKTINTHKELIKSRDKLRKDFITYDNLKSQYICYKLKNGKMITRYYYIPNELAKSAGVYDLLKTKQVILAENSFINKPENIHSLMISSPKNVISSFISDHDQILSFLEEVKKDMIIDTIDHITKEENNYYYNQMTKDIPIEKPPIESYLSIMFEFKPKDQEGNILTQKDYPYETFPRDRRDLVLNSFEHTKTWLLENGYDNIFE